MPKDRIVHFNLKRDGQEIKLPAETVFEIRDKIGEMGKGNDKGVSPALAFIKGSEPHWHEATHEYYFVVSGEGTALIDGFAVSLEPFDWLEIPLNSVHSVSSKEGMFVLVMTSPPWSAGDHHLTTKKRK